MDRLVMVMMSDVYVRMRVTIAWHKSFINIGLWCFPYLKLVNM